MPSNGLQIAFGVCPDLVVEKIKKDGFNPDENYNNMFGIRDDSKDEVNCFNMILKQK